PSQMGLSFVSSRPFVTSIMIGASKLVEVMMNVVFIEVTLSDEVITVIEAIHTAQPNQSP
ncbi:aldo/keto reductase, partial [Pseudomonas syringae pv. tagetis]